MNRASERQARYDAKNTRTVIMKLNTKTDADILDWLDRQDSKQGSIKKAIRETIKAGTKE